MAARPIMLSGWLKFQVPGVSIFQKSIVLIFLGTVGIFLTSPTTTVLKYLLMSSQWWSPLYKVMGKWMNNFSQKLERSLGGSLLSWYFLCRLDSDTQGYQFRMAEILSFSCEKCYAEIYPILYRAYGSLIYIDLCN